MKNTAFMYVTGVAFTFMLFAPIVFVHSWKLKAFITLGVNIVQFTQVNDLSNPKFYILEVIIFVVSFVMIALFRSQNKLIYDYLDELQGKKEEDKYWKQLIDEFHDGVAVVSED